MSLESTASTKIYNGKTIVIYNYIQQNEKLEVELEVLKGS